MLRLLSFLSDTNGANSFLSSLTEPKKSGATKPVDLVPEAEYFEFPAMNRMSKLRRSDGPNHRNLIVLYTQEDFEGDSCELVEDNLMLKKIFPHERVRSITVVGNPWALYAEQGCWVSMDT